MLIHTLTLFVASAAIVGNSLVSHIILHSKFVKKTPFNYVLLNLAILDVITSIVAVYRVLIHGLLYHENKSDIIMRVYNQSHVGAEVMCKINQSFWIGAKITPLFLLVIAYERYKAVVKPLSRMDSDIFKGKLKIVVLLCWSCGALTNVVFMLSRNVGKQGCKSIIVEWFNGSTYSLITGCLLSLLPTVVMSVLYYKVIKAIKRDEQLGFQATVQRAREASKRKVIVIIIAVTVLFYAFCGIPEFFFITKAVFGLELFYNYYVQTLLYSINSLSNPLIYFIFLKSFRMGIKSVFTCRIGHDALPFTANRKSESVQVACHDNVLYQNEFKHIELLSIKELPKQ